MTEEGAGSDSERIAEELLIPGILLMQKSVQLVLHHRTLTYQLLPGAHHMLQGSYSAVTVHLG